MDIEKLSASAYKQHCNCPHSYFIGNILSYRFPSNKGAALGTVTHKCLEFLARIKFARQNKESLCKLDIGEYDTAKPDIADIIEKNYTFCIAKDDLKHIEWTDEQYKLYKKYVNTALNHNNGQFNPFNRSVYKTEQYINFLVQENWAILPDDKRFRITGIIDLIYTDNDIMEVVDWKTAKTMQDFHTGKVIDYDSLHNDIQLRLYHYALSETYGCNRTYILTMFFLKQAKPISISLGCNDVEDTKNLIKTKFLEIYNTKIPKLNRTWKCRWCDYATHTFEGTNIKPITQFLDGGLAQVGNPATICDQVSLEINRHGLKWTIENMKSEK